MRTLKFTILALPMLIASCAGEEIVKPETVEVSFSAEMPTAVSSRADADYSVNQVVCAVFENNAEIAALRKTIDIIPGGEIKYTPRLVKGHTYQVAFFARNGQAYNCENMTNIALPASYNGDVTTYECFSATVEATAGAEGTNHTVVLTRPMARLNLGITAADKQAVSDLGYTLTKVDVKLNVNSTFDALNQTSSGSQEYTLSLPAQTTQMTVGSQTYNSLASYMVFPGDNTAITYTVYGKKGEGAEEVLISKQIDNVPFGINQNTNIVGDLVTGEISCAISMSPAYSEGDNNKEL